jgi:hypothetical protein
VIGGRPTVVRVAVNRRAPVNAALRIAGINKRWEAAWPIAAANTPTAYAALAPATDGVKIK